VLNYLKAWTGEESQSRYDETLPYRSPTTIRELVTLPDHAGSRAGIVFVPFQETPLIEEDEKEEEEDDDDDDDERFPQNRLRRAMEKLKSHRQSLEGTEAGDDVKEGEGVE
jgi:hypothetical protein